MYEGGDMKIVIWEDKGEKSKEGGGGSEVRVVGQWANLKEEREKASIEELKEVVVMEVTNVVKGKRDKGKLEVV